MIVITKLVGAEDVVVRVGTVDVWCYVVLLVVVFGVDSCDFYVALGHIALNCHHKFMLWSWIVVYCSFSTTLCLVSCSKLFNRIQWFWRKFQQLVLVPQKAFIQFHLVCGSLSLFPASFVFISCISFWIWYSRENIVLKLLHVFCASGNHVYLWYEMLNSLVLSVRVHATLNVSLLAWK